MAFRRVFEPDAPAKPFDDGSYNEVTDPESWNNDETPGLEAILVLRAGKLRLVYVSVTYRW